MVPTDPTLLYLFNIICLYYQLSYSIISSHLLPSLIRILQWLNTVTGVYHQRLREVKHTDKCDHTSAEVFTPQCESLGHESTRGSAALRLRQRAPQSRLILSPDDWEAVVFLGDKQRQGESC